MMKSFRFLCSVAAALCCVVAVSACGFKARTADDMPLVLRTMRLETQNVASGIESDMISFLSAMKVRYRTASPTLILMLSNSHASVHLPVYFDSGSATSIFYSLVMNVQLNDPSDNKVIWEKKIKVSQSVTINANQTVSPVMTPLMRHTLRRKILIVLEGQLLGPSVQKKINQHFSKKGHR